MDFSVSLSCQTETSPRGACGDSKLAMAIPRDSAVLGNQASTVPWQPAVTHREIAHYTLGCLVQLPCESQGGL